MNGLNCHTNGWPSLRSYVSVWKAKEEAAEAEQAKKELGLDGESSLRSMIMKKQAAREKEMDSFFAHLEAKYAEPEKKKPKKKGKWYVEKLLSLQNTILTKSKHD